MFRKILFFLLFSSVAFAADPPMTLFDEGVKVGPIFQINCVGSAIQCTKSGILGAITISSTGASTECSTASCNLNVATTLNSKNICLADGTNCPSSSGDMTKAVYDIGNSGVVDNAESVNWADIKNIRVQPSDINWGAIQEVQTGDINWVSVGNQEIQSSGINWVSLNNSIQGGAINWVALTNEIQTANINWSSVINNEMYASGINWVDIGVNGLFKSDGSTAPSAYGGTSCTNQFPRSLDASGAATCASVAIGSDVSGLGTGVATFLGTPSSANLASAVTDEQGSGKAVFDTSPTLTTPNVGVATATSINKVAITAPATSATLTIVDGKTLTASNTITLTGTDSTSYNLDKLTPRTNTVASSATPSINTDTTDIFTITALAAAITSMTTNLSGSPVNGQKLIIRILDNGTARTIAWGTSFASRGVTLPTTTIVSKYLYVGFIYNSTTSTWDCVAVAQEQ